MTLRRRGFESLIAIVLALGGLTSLGAQAPPAEIDHQLGPWEALPDSDWAPSPPKVPDPIPVPRAASQKGGYPQGHVLVRYRDEVPEWHRSGLSIAAGARAYRPARFAPFARVEVPPGEDPAALVARLQQQPEVEWAELDVLCWSHFQASQAAQFNDPLLPLQWSYQRINLLPALDSNPGMGQGVIVAVIDTGVAFGSGPGFPTRRGVDLGETRFAPGWDFVDNNVLPYDEGSAFDSGDPLSPRFGHGTFAAAQIAAVADNGIAGIGVAPRSTIMPLRVLGRSGSGTFSDVAEAIHFATANGAKVINMSLGGSQGTTALAQAVQAARRAGVVLIASAGNEAQEDDFDGDVSFPARYPEVLSVGATRFDGNRAGYSSTGPGVVLMAPAGQGIADLGGGLRDAALSTSFVHDPRTGETVYGAFWSTGTSFASPQVAGAAALLFGLGVRDGEAVERMLLDSTRNLGPDGFDEQHGWGLLDVLEAHRGLGL